MIVNEALLGEKNLGSRIISAPPSEQGLLITYAIMDMFSNPENITLAAAAPEIQGSAA